MDFVERVETSSDPLNFTSSTPHSNNNTTNNTVDECDELETKTNSNTTKTNNPTMRSTSFPIEVPVTEVSFSLQCTGTSTKTDNKSKMFTVYNIKVSALSTRWIVPKRFSELELLNEALRKRYPQSRLPKFPSKGGLGGLFSRRLDDSTIKKRRSDLQTYLDGALANPMVYKSQLLRLFFEIPRGIAQAHSEADERALVRAAQHTDSAGTDDCSNDGGVDNFSGRRGDGILISDGRNSSDSTSIPKQIVLFSNQSHPELSFDVQGMRLAIKNGDLIVVQQILDLDKKLGRYVDSAGQSMLHLACIFSHTEIAMLLLDVGADPEIRNAHGETAFDLAPPALAQKMRLFIEDWEKTEFTIK